MSPVDIHSFLSDLRWQQIPTACQTRTRLLLLDLLGTGLAATATPLHHIVKDYVHRHHGQGNARVMFSEATASAEGAALVGGMTIDAVDAHDGHRLTKGHVGCAMLPALLALIDASGKKLTGEAFLTLLTAGYEMGTRSGMALHATAPDYHTSGAWNAITCAALGAHLLDLEADQFAHSLGIAEFHGPRSQMMRNIDHPTMLKDGSGWGAKVGVASALLAEAGFTGAPALTVTSDEVTSFWSNLGQEWEVMKQYIKGFPVCRWAQPAAQAMLNLVAETPIEPKTVKRIDVVTFHEATRLFSGIPMDTEQAQYAITFPVAAALARGKIGMAEISGPAFTDPILCDLAGKIILAEQASYNDAFPAERWAHVAVTLHDGSCLRSRPTQAQGDPETPYSDAEITAKFYTLAGSVIAEPHLHQIETAVRGLDATTESFEELQRVVYSKAIPVGAADAE